ncbi:MAG: DMT family transporter [Cyanobacteria bacterium P01_G01_bin.39]
MLNKISGRGYLLIAILIFAAANSVTRKLTELGADNLINGHNPISFCNVLFVGNLCALAVLIAIYSSEFRSSHFRRLTLPDWISMTAVAILAGALAPAMFFFALEKTAVNNVVLIGRIEPPVTLALAVLILREKVNNLIVIGAILAFIGVILTIVLQPETNDMVTMGGFNIGRGELMTAIGAIALAIANIISKVKLDSIPLGLFTIYRTALGTVIFFCLAVKLYGYDHFTNVFTPILWQWMLLYGAIIVVGGQLAWLRGLQDTNAADVSLASSISPIAGIIAAFLILGEVPTMAHYIGGSVVIIGIVLNQIGTARLNSPKKGMDEQVGFKGI